MTLVDATTRRTASACLTLAVLTLMVAHGPWRYRAVEAVPFDQVDFAKAFDPSSLGGNPVAADSAVMLLESADGKPRYAAHPIPYDEAATALSIRADVRAQAIVEGEERWQYASLMAVSFDRQGRRMWWLPREIATVTGSSDWRTYTMYLPLPLEVREVVLLAFNAAANGSMWLRNVRIQVIEERTVVSLARIGLIAAWLVLGLLIVVRLVRTQATVLRITALAMALAILGFGLAPQPHASQLLVSAFYGIQDLLRGDLGDQAATSPTAPPSPPVSDPEPAKLQDQPQRSNARSPAATEAPSSSSIAPRQATRIATSERTYWRPSFLRSDKNLHVIGFALFAMVMAVAWRQRLPMAMAGTIGLSLTLQVLQSLTVTREPDLVDLAHDFVGIAVGMVVAVVALGQKFRVRR